jgi:DNA-binding LacI/PurR family transcriptional regulator
MQGTGVPSSLQTSPLYEQVKQQIRLSIENGSIAPGELLPGQRELQARYNVSGITIRRALTDLARDGLIKRVTGVGTFVRRIKQPPRVAMLMIGFDLVQHWQPRSRTFSHIMAGIGEVAWQSWKSFSVYKLESVDAAIRLLERASWHEFDGILLRSNRSLDPRVVEALETLGLPYVAFRHGLCGHAVNFITADDFHEAEQLTAHLIERGYRRIAFVGPPAPDLFNLKYGGYAAALRSVGVALDESIVLQGKSYALEQAEHYASVLFDRPDRPDAVFFCLDAPVTKVFMAAAQKRGLEVPRDFGFVLHGAYDDDVGLALTYGGYSQFALGRAGAELLTKVIADPHAPPQKLVLPLRVVLGDSTPHAKTVTVTLRPERTGNGIGSS